MKRIQYDSQPQNAEEALKYSQELLRQKILRNSYLRGEAQTQAGDDAYKLDNEFAQLLAEAEALGLIQRGENSEGFNGEIAEAFVRGTKATERTLDAIEYLGELGRLGIDLSNTFGELRQYAEGDLAIPFPLISKALFEGAQAADELLAHR